jgi:hypothetical protein
VVVFEGMRVREELNYKSEEDSVIFGEDIVYEADYSHDYDYRN